MMTEEQEQQATYEHYCSWLQRCGIEPPRFEVWLRNRYHSRHTWGKQQARPPYLKKDRVEPNL
jgi:hypothetical protein